MTTKDEILLQIQNLKSCQFTAGIFAGEGDSAAAGELLCKCDTIHLRLTKWIDSICDDYVKPGESTTIGGDE